MFVWVPALPPPPDPRPPRSDPLFQAAFFSNSQKDIPGMFLLHGHFLRINGLIDADGLKNSGAEGGRMNGPPWGASRPSQTPHPFRPFQRRPPGLHCPGVGVPGQLARLGSGHELHGLVLAEPSCQGCLPLTHLALPQALKACTKGCFTASPRETLFLGEQEEEVLRGGHAGPAGCVCHC